MTQKTRPKDKVYLTFKLDWNDFKFQKVRPKNPMYPGPTSRRKMDQNTKTFVGWLMYILQKHSMSKALLPEGKNYDSTTITMNAKNINVLHDLLHPFDWLNFAPTLDDKLSDGEYGVRIDQIIVDDPEYHR